MPDTTRARRRILYFLEAPLRRGALVLAPVVFVSLLAAAIAQLLPPRYRASALVGVEWDTADEALLQQRGIDVAARRDQLVRQRASERGLLERVLREAAPHTKVVDTSAPFDARIDRLLSELRVRPMASSSFVIEFVDRDPATAALVPNLIARQLAPEPSAATATDGSLRALEVRLEEARRVLKQKADAIGRPAPNAPESIRDEDAAPPDEDALAEKRAVAASLATARARAERLQLLIDAESRSGAAPSPQAELEHLRDQLAELRKRYTEEHPDVEKLRRQIVRLEASLPSGSSGPPAPRAELRATQAEIQLLVARQAELEARTAPPARVAPRPAASRAAAPGREQALAEHQRAQLAYDTLLEEWRATRAAAPLSRGPAIRFERLRDATVPPAPESPNPTLFVLTGALAGLLTGLVAALVAEQRDRRVKGPEDLEEILPVPLLATLPEARGQDVRH